MSSRKRWLRKAENYEDGIELRKFFKKKWAEMTERLSKMAIKANEKMDEFNKRRKEDEFRKERSERRRQRRTARKSTKRKV